MKIEFKPVVMLENYITQTFDLQKKGQKLLKVGFVLSGITVGVSIMQLAALLLCGSDLHLWWRSVIPWIPIFAWAYWRFFIRYLHPEAFVCEHCGRLKCLKARSPKYFGKTKVCSECEKREKSVNASLESVNKQLDLLKKDLAFVSKYPDATEDPSSEK